LRRLTNTRTDLANRNDSTRELNGDAIIISLECDSFTVQSFRTDNFSISMQALIEQMEELRNCLDSDMHVLAGNSPMARGVTGNKIDTSTMTMVELVVASNAIVLFTGVAINLSIVLQEAATNRLLLFRGTKYEALAESVIADIGSTHITELKHE